MPGATWSKNPMAEESKMADDLPAHLSASQLPRYGVAALTLTLALALALALALTLTLNLTLTLTLTLTR